MISFTNKVFKILLTRPNSALRHFDQYVRFFITHGVLKFFGPGEGIELGDNVRLQSYGSLMAEKPSAKIKIEENCILYKNNRLEAYQYGSIKIGAGSILGEVKIYSREAISIGKGVVASWNVLIQDYDPHPVSRLLRSKQISNMVNNFSPNFSKNKNLTTEIPDWNFPASVIEIGDDVWIGANTTILKGARIGNGCIIAAGSVVTSGVYPENSVIAGNPGQVIKKIDDSSFSRCSSSISSYKSVSNDQWRTE